MYGAPLRHRNTAAQSPGSAADGSELVDMYGAPLRHRNAIAPSLGSAANGSELVDMYGAPLRHRNAFAQAGDSVGGLLTDGPEASRERPRASGPIGDIDGAALQGRSLAMPRSGESDPEEHFSSRKPSMRPQDHSNLFDDGAAPQYYLADQTAGDFRGQPYVSLPSRRKVSGSPPSNPFAYTQ